jgi:transglutaminase-like putative cysteine protease
MAQPFDTATLYDIALSFRYVYSSPASTSRHLLRLMPLNIAGEQQLISGYVQIEPRPDDRRDGVDFFGNAQTQIAYDRPLNRAEFRLTARVRRTAQPPQLDLSPAIEGLVDELAATRTLAPLSPHHFLADSARARVTPAITDYARRAVDPQRSVLQAVGTLASTVHRDMAFDAKATDVQTDPAEAFAKRRGVCQDFSHITIAALRGLGIPAGYVSGVLRTIPPPGKERLEGADAMHAWVMAWCGVEMGWVQFDPTNDTMVTNDHVVVAMGRDYADVAPVTGALRASGRHKSSHKVDVVPL